MTDEQLLREVARMEGLESGEFYPSVPGPFEEEWGLLVFELPADHEDHHPDNRYFFNPITNAEQLNALIEKHDICVGRRNENEWGAFQHRYDSGWHTGNPKLNRFGTSDELASDPDYRMATLIACFTLVSQSLQSSTN